MERIYRALAGLSGVALVAGCFNLAMLLLNVGQQLSYGDGAGVLSGLLLYEGLLGFFRVAVSTLMDGVAIMGIVVAWADGRRKWLLALVIATALPAITPALFLAGPTLLAAHPRIGSLIGQNYYLLVSAVSLLPTALALAFARLRGGGLATLRAEEDASLDITRSRL